MTRDDFLAAPADFDDRPIHPLTRWLIVILCALLAAILAWTALAEIDSRVVAEGVIEPAGRVKRLNHPQGGRVVSIAVEEGQRVEIGEVLLTFDQTEARAGYNALRAQLETARAVSARLAAEASGEEPAFPPDLEALRPDLIAEQRALFAARTRARSDEATRLTSVIARREGEIKTLEAERERLSRSHGLIAEQLSAVRRLADKGLYPKLKVVAIERQVSDLAGQIAKTAEQLDTARAALNEAQSAREGRGSDDESRVLSELAAARQTVERLEEQVQEREAALRSLVVRAPVDGVVQDLTVAAVGQSVAPNAPILTLVPSDPELVVSAEVPEDAIASVETGMPADLKIRAYDYLRHGTVPGVVALIDADAAVDEAGGGRFYEVRIAMPEAAGTGLELQPGMAVDVEVVGPKRTVLSFLTDRLFKATDDAFKEG